jgi:hypothetical protein
MSRRDARARTGGDRADGRYALRAGEEVVDANDVRALREQAIAEMRAEEACAPGNQYARFKWHVSRLPHQLRDVHRTA